MLAVSIKGPTYEEIVEQIHGALPHADLLELRLDLFHQIDVQQLKAILNQFNRCFIFTVKQSHIDLEQLAALNPAYMDLEYTIEQNTLKRLKTKFPSIKFIISFHDYHQTPQNLDEIYRMVVNKGGDYSKLAVTANNTVDALRLAHWRKGKNEALIAISMGIPGQCSRILSPTLKNSLTYASLNDSVAVVPGQLSAQFLKEKYHYDAINEKTALFGLLGDPVNLSVSDVCHNYIFNLMNLNALYLKMQVKIPELAETLSLVKELGFKGLSITMPLKEAVLSYIDHVDTEAAKIGAVNTLLFKKGKIYGYNTDGIGALNAIEKTGPVRDKRLVLLGAGGAARAIAFEACKRGAKVTIVNRTLEKANKIATQLGCEAKHLDQMPSLAREGYDILVNSTPLEMPVDPNSIIPHSIVMDIKTRPPLTSFLSVAKEKKCSLVFGYQMFAEQAMGQYRHWFSNSFPSETFYLLETKLKSVL